MTHDDHRAAAREMATVHRSVVGFEIVLDRIFRDAQAEGRMDQRAKRVRGRLLCNLYRVRRRLAKIQADMREVHTRTLPEKAACWEEVASGGAPIPQRDVTGKSALDWHVTAARLLGPSQPAIDRFLKIVSSRKHLPVRILDTALRMDDVIQFIRCEMEHLQAYTSSGRGIPWRNCWLGMNIDFEGESEEKREESGENTTITMGNVAFGNS